jgi:hypothetical protein
MTYEIVTNDVLRVTWCEMTMWRMTYDIDDVDDVVMSNTTFYVICLHDIG